VEPFRKGLLGRQVERVGRRGKNVLFRLDGGRALLVNLGMTGRLLLPEPGGSEVDGRHPGVRIHFHDGTPLTYDDVRRFGALEVLGARRWRLRNRALGPEPLSAGFTSAALGESLSHSRSPIRSWLLDQRRVAGVGNIYANEALWEARIHPLRPASSLDGGEVRRLHRSLRRILRAAIEARGTTLRDYRDSSGGEGSFGHLLRVYGRDGHPCPRCGTAVERGVLSNRSIFVCRRCQPAGGVPLPRT
jgi:formamidopyrimidine-DNA glycosylase